jgi:hypothetical protein
MSTIDEPHKADNGGRFVYSRTFFGLLAGLSQAVEPRLSVIRREIALDRRMVRTIPSPHLFYVGEVNFNSRGENCR